MPTQDNDNEKDIQQENLEVQAEEQTDVAETQADVTPEQPVNDTATPDVDLNDNVDDAPDESEPVTVQSVRFSSFDSADNVMGEENKNLDILMDIKLQLTVELGRCEIPIKKVLELTRGSIIELDKIAGEPVELFANGKHIANGEVVVIEDNFGLRITSITEPEERVKMDF